MAGTNEFFFCCGSMCTRGGPESGRKKKMPFGFVHGYFEFQFARETTLLGELEGCPFLPEESSLFPPFLSLSVGLPVTFHRFSKYPFAKYPFASF